jgi:hypothetical protein
MPTPPHTINVIPPPPLDCPILATDGMIPLKLRLIVGSHQPPLWQYASPVSPPAAIAVDFNTNTNTNTTLHN